MGSPDDDPARVAMSLAAHVKDIQKSFNAIEECCKPVVAAVHGACVGGGVDMITACDIRYIFVTFTVISTIFNLNSTM